MKIVQSLELGSLEPFADAFLPAAAFLEKEGHVTTWEGRGQRLRRVRDPEGLSIPDWEIFASLALACGGDLGFESLDELHEEMGELLAPLDVPSSPPAPSEPEKTAEGLTLFTYPLLVDEGRLSERADELKAALGERPFVEIHPDDAAAAHVADGDDLVLKTAAGEATLPARVTEHVAKGSVFVPFNQAGFQANTLLDGDFVTSVTVEPAAQLVEASAEAGGRRLMDWLDWLLLAARVVIVFFALLISVLVYIWFERKIIADMQTRMGPMRAGPRGILHHPRGRDQALLQGGDPPDERRPAGLSRSRRSSRCSRLSSRSARSRSARASRCSAGSSPSSSSDLDIGILWVLAMTSIAVYGVVLAGWSSGSNYPLLGAVRSSAQMISYEVAMGLSLVAVLMYSGHLSFSEIVAAQDRVWNVVPMFPAFVLYMICAIAETNRPPFDLAEAESELVAGFHTEYSGITFAMFFLGEYVATVTVAAIGVTLFLGGWRGPAPDFLPWLWPFLWFLFKVTLVIYVFVLVRATLPRVRYDRLMAFGWKVLIPFGLVLGARSRVRSSCSPIAST